ncbi:3-oxoacyl-ACP reductase FabG [Buchnera aphidicola]|uniref:3-oxoacyl-[acyl-carrier-protein] reductase FabG n=1 Tax=Buchnera aphidicola (Cinara strobi) TaxID=1921549 RepID=A0A3B1E7W5_9GAMM|nr:3-oxoacyl-ACP reductase FabG [Buchnera aphidicola]VAX76597.1 3-oxoacyl-[acyl-carrier-protein] reductase FabG [Buchnera aphidicola (Cinara strobi)]
MKNKKIALVTGSSKGIGKNISTELIKSGRYVIGTTTTKKGKKEIQKNFKKNGTGIILDLKNIIDTKNKIKETINKFKIIDIFVYNAGIIYDNLLITMKESEWNNVININLSSIFYITKIIIPYMIKKRYGRIIIIGSLSGNLGQKGQTNYSASKAGLIGFSKSLALEVATKGITVNIVSPGYIKTNMTKNFLSRHKKEILKKIPMGYIGKPKDIAHIVSFLSSKKSSYITGQNIHVNGGAYINFDI